MSTPVVVQGTPVAHPSTIPSSAGGGGYAGSAPVANNNGASGDGPHGGEKQETRCNDPIFALLFYVCIGAIVAVAAIKGPSALTAPKSNVNFEPYIIYTIVIAIVSILVSGVALSVLMCIPETLIKISLIFVTIMALVWAVLAFVTGSIAMGVIGIIFFLISVCYAWAVWSRIPFATINLVTAITAVKANMGVVIYAYIFTAVAGLWSFTWSVAVVGVFDETYTCDDNNVCSNPNYGYLFLLFLAFFFGHQVFQVRNKIVRVVALFC
jgi:Plasma-membrane choline transporter